MQSIGGGEQPISKQSSSQERTRSRRQYRTCTTPPHSLVNLVLDVDTTRHLGHACDAGSAQRGRAEDHGHRGGVGEQESGGVGVVDRDQATSSAYLIAGSTPARERGYFGKQAFVIFFDFGILSNLHVLVTCCAWLGHWLLTCRDVQQVD